MKNRILIILFLFFFGNSFPQENDTIQDSNKVQYDKAEQLSPLQFNKEEIQRIKEQKEFNYLEQVREESWWTRFKKWMNAKYNQFITWLFGPYKANSILAFIIEIIPFILLLIFTALIAWLFSRLNPGGRILKQPRTSEVFLNEEEELVKSQDLPSLIQKAVKEGNFRLAVRYYYLNELKKLDQSELIDYEFQKTNQDYSVEIQDAVLRKHFGEISKLYEFIWYGSFQVSETDYRLVEKGFLRMDAALKSIGHE